MKKNCLLFCFAFVIGIMLLTGCDKKLETTNLSNIYLDNMTIGMKINKDDLTNYTDSDRYSYDYKYKFEEIVIDTNCRCSDRLTQNSSMEMTQNSPRL